MIIEDIIFTLKDGRQALLRCPTEADIEGTIDYLNLSAAETDFLLRYPEECGQYTYEGEKQLFEYWNASDYEASLVCVVDGRVAGNCLIAFNRKMKYSHRAGIGIALIKEFWNLGIGTRMMEELIKIARRKEGIKQLELEYIEGNSRARALYEKMGFRVAGVHPNAVILKDGTMLNEYLMIKTL